MVNYKESQKRKEEQWEKHPDFIAARKAFNYMLYTLGAIILVNSFYVTFLYESLPLPSAVLDFTAKSFPSISCPLDKLNAPNAIINEDMLLRKRWLYSAHGYSMTVGLFTGVTYCLVCAYLMLIGKIRPSPSININKHERWKFIRYIGFFILVIACFSYYIYFGKCDFFTYEYKRETAFSYTLLLWTTVVFSWIIIAFSCSVIRFYIENGRISQPEMDNDKTIT